jgi:hypothetical protein
MSTQIEGCEFDVANSKLLGCCIQTLDIGTWQARRGALQ